MYASKAEKLRASARSIFWEDLLHESIRLGHWKPVKKCSTTGNDSECPWWSTRANTMPCKSDRVLRESTCPDKQPTVIPTNAQELGHKWPTDSRVVGIPAQRRAEHPQKTTLTATQHVFTRKRHPETTVGQLLAQQFKRRSRENQKIYSSTNYLTSKTRFAVAVQNR